MSCPSERIFRHRSIAALLAGQDQSGSDPQRIAHVHSLGPVRVPVPPLPTGGHFFERWPVRELPDQGLWEADHYDSYAPPLFVLHDVLLHSSAGILAIDDHVVGETLVGTNGRDHGYRALAKGIALSPEEIIPLAGNHISLLVPGSHDVRNTMLHGLCRLTAVPENYLVAADGLLVPAGGAHLREALGLLDLLPSLAVREVEITQTFRVETLILPLSVCGEAAYHPCAAELYRRISLNVPPSVPPGSARLPRRIFIDNRATGFLPLRNAGVVMAELARMGFQPVRLEALSLADQVRLFRQAEAIVAPPGAALTNLGFCRPGTLVIELLMDAFVDWSFRNLAALFQLRYDCVLGRGKKPMPEIDAWFAATPWEISENHVVAAVAHSLAPARRAETAAAEAA